MYVHTDRVYVSNIMEVCIHAGVRACMCTDIPNRNRLCLVALWCGMLSRIFVDMHLLTHTSTRARTHTRAHEHAHSNTDVHVMCHDMNAYMRINWEACTTPWFTFLMRARTRARAHTHTHTHTHTAHTHMPVAMDAYYCPWLCVSIFVGCIFSFFCM